MNDRFKFRVYFKYNNMMYDIASFCYLEQLNKCVFHFNDGSQKTLKLKDFEIMQCAGLKDKNGKLIYEGDIVKVKDEIFFIKYEIGSFLIVRNQQSLDCWYEMFTECWNDDVYPLSQLWIDEYIQEDFIECLEIIGNIYENPELLEQMRDFDR